MWALDFSGSPLAPRVKVQGETASVFYARHWLLTKALVHFGRDELLEKSVQTGANLAPVYSANEFLERGITRSGNFAENQVQISLSKSSPMKIPQTEKKKLTWLYQDIDGKQNGNNYYDNWKRSKL